MTMVAAASSKNLNLKSERLAKSDSFDGTCKPTLVDQNKTRFKK
jgi:hypothetical protein